MIKLSALCPSTKLFYNNCEWGRQATAHTITLKNLRQILKSHLKFDSHINVQSVCISYLDGKHLETWLYRFTCEFIIVFSCSQTPILSYLLDQCLVIINAGLCCGRNTRTGSKSNWVEYFLRLRANLVWLVIIYIYATRGVPGNM